ncbi:MAG: ATP-binding cassette domain-containing protein, partial [Granulosicoccus sp.]
MNSAITLEALTVDFDERFKLCDINWQIEPGQHWLVCGANGSGKSALAAVLASAGQIQQGTVQGLPDKVAIVSYESQGELIEAERRKDDADIMDVISEGTPAREIIGDVCEDDALAEQLIDQFGLRAVIDRSFRKLSTGETRKLMLIRALTSRPDLLVLDEPFDGLDAATHEQLQAHLQRLSASVPMVLVLNRFDEKPEFVTHTAYMAHGCLQTVVSMDDPAAFQDLYQLLHLKTTELDIPPADPALALPTLQSNQPLVRIRSAKIAYGDTVIFEG